MPTGSQDLRRDGVCHAGDIPDLGSCRHGEARTEVKRLANSVALEAKPAALRGDPILWGMVVGSYTGGVSILEGLHRWL